VFSSCGFVFFSSTVSPFPAVLTFGLLQTPHYVQVVGYINQQAINILPEDYGGEMVRSLPSLFSPFSGSLFHLYRTPTVPTSAVTLSVVSSSRTPSAAPRLPTEPPPPERLTSKSSSGTTSWAPTPSASRLATLVTSSATLCARSVVVAPFIVFSKLIFSRKQHIFDRIGCTYNAPANYAAINGTFQSCLGDDQLYPGVYVENGATRTYTQPPESLGDESFSSSTPSLMGLTPLPPRTD
jgi:hypothetical protein